MEIKWSQVFKKFKSESLVILDAEDNQIRYNQKSRKHAL